ncbi:MAG: acyl-CoA dehydrogenase domain protein [Bacteroidota bacterium]|nr:acyl-CoA dehydrogenase domain protein [Bacteroidota bacterium]
MTDHLNSAAQDSKYDFFVAFARKELNNDVFERDKNQVFAAGEWEKCGNEKLQGLCISKEYGGLGFSAIETVNALEGLAYGCEDAGLMFSLVAQLLSCSIPLVLYGTEEQKKRYLPLLCSGKLMVANAITEKNAGSDVFSMQTSAMRKNNIYVLNGEKNYITNAPNADMLLLYAVTNKDKGFYGGISAFIVEDLKNKGVSLSGQIDKKGLRSCLMGDITLKDVEVSAENLLGKEGAGAMIFLESMNWERALLGAVHVGTMKRILEKSIAYLNARTIKGEPIGKHQANSQRIAEMHVLVETARLWVHKAAMETDLCSETISITSSAAKLYVSEAFNKVCDMALLIFGAKGYTTEASIERYKRDAVAATIYSGTNDIQKNIISKWLGL